MSILSRIFGGAKEPDPLDGLDEPAALEGEELGLFPVDATQRPASVALRVEQLRARAPGAEPQVVEQPEDEGALEELSVDDIVEPAELLPKSPMRDEPEIDLDAVMRDAAAPAEGEDPAEQAVASVAPDEDAVASAEAAEAVEGEDKPAPGEVQTIAAPKDADALSMFRSTGANTELTALTEGIEDEAAGDLLKEAREISSWLEKKDVA